jgi:hypothetical protein
MSWCWDKPSFTPFGSPESPQFGTRLPHHRETHIHPHRVHPRSTAAPTTYLSVHIYSLFLITSKKPSVENARPIFRRVAHGTLLTMPARKRAHEEMEVEEPVEAPSTLQKLRNMWQFANLAQYISLFGDAVKIDRDLDIEVRSVCARRHCECASHAPIGEDADVHTGAGERVSQASGLGEACTDWTGAAEARLVAQGLDVRYCALCSHTRADPSQT